MSCGKASRELLERFRFGEELDARSAPHLDHLQSCHSCREAVGLDRALVMQLRRALQARVDGYAPSDAAWDGVRQRALADAGTRTRWFAWLGRVTTGLRAAGAVAAVALIVILGAQGDSGDGQVADFQLRATGRGELVRANAMPTDPPPREEPAPYRGGRAPLPPPASGRMSVIMTYSETGEALATVHPAPRRISGLLQ
jgi:anti-sigma factor RsiW